MGSKLDRICIDLKIVDYLVVECPVLIIKAIGIDSIEKLKLLIDECSLFISVGINDTPGYFIADIPLSDRVIV